MWNIKGIWNEGLLSAPRRDIVKRDYIYASDIGKPFLDRYYSMMGEQPTNTFESRVLRVFEAGNLFEWVVKRVLVRSGILIAEQKPVLVKIPKMLDIHGRLDFIAGGKPDFKKAMADLNKEEYLPPNMMAIAKEIIKKLQEIYPDGLESCVLEVKSVNSLAFWRHVDQLKGAYPHHIMQNYTYMKSERLNGKLLYISKDDLCLEEVDIQLSGETENKWMDDIKYMTEIFKSGHPPSREDDLVFDELKQEWKINWRIQRSQYLEKITNFNSQEEWTEYAEKKCRKINREFKGKEELTHYRKKYKDEYRKEKGVKDDEATAD